MATIGKWNGHSFEVSSQIIRSFTDLTIKGSSETENKTSSGHGYVSRKNSKPAEVGITVGLSALTGCDPRSEATAFVNEANAGSSDYFYVGGQKLVPYKLMLTNADVTEVEIAPGGKWVSCKVKLTMKQCAVPDDTKTSSSSSGGGSSGSSSKKSSSKKASTKTSSKTTTKNNTVDAVSGAAPSVSSVLKSTAKAVSAVSKVVSTAKKVASTVSKVTSTVKKVTSSVSSKIKSLLK
jgi:hypothetical protein